MTNGMKSGSGSDPFADVDTSDSNKEEDTGKVETTDKSEKSELSETTSSTPDGLPFIYARSGVKQARDHTFQLHYLTETYQEEKRIQSEIENRLGEDVYKVDLREAAMKAAFENIDDMAEILREWGYDAE